MKRSQCLKVLHTHNFIVQDSDFFLESNDLYYCYNQFLNIGFVVKEYPNYCSDSIMSDVALARSILREINANVWNTYFIILLSNDNANKNTKDQLDSSDANKDSNDLLYRSDTNKDNNNPLDSSNFNKDSNKEFYQIERDSKGLRKYLILEEEDLYRIPFIRSEKEQETSLNFASDFNEILKTKDQDVNELVEWIFSQDGEYKEIQKKNIKIKINEILALES